MPVDIYNATMAANNIYTVQALLDLHDRTHTSFKKLLRHCGVLSDKELNKKLKGFGISSVHSQLFHMIGAERYWLSVVRGSMHVSMNQAEHPELKHLRSFRAKTAKLTRDYLEQAKPAELNRARKMLTYGGKEQMLVPAHVILRVTTHAFQHQGQVLAMSRLLGHPGPRGMDFPLKPWFH